jgi:hypothetical protein
VVAHDRPTERTALKKKAMFALGSIELESIVACENSANLDLTKERRRALAGAGIDSQEAIERISSIAYGTVELALNPDPSISPMVA